MFKIVSNVLAEENGSKVDSGGYGWNLIKFLDHHPFFRGGEQRAIASVVRILPKNPIILEIGTFKGWSAILMAKLRPDAKIITLDPHIGIPGHPEINSSEQEVIKNLMDEKVLNQVQHVVTKSEDYIINSVFDMVFIDGGHTFKDVRKDFYKVKDFIKEGGWFVFHDYNEMTGVKKFISTLKIEKYRLDKTIFMFKKCHLNC